jgi:hypothetical protein
MFGTLTATFGGWAIWRLEGAPWFDAPAAKVLVAETHAAALATKTPTRFLRGRRNAQTESVPA